MDKKTKSLRDSEFSSGLTGFCTTSFADVLNPLLVSPFF